MRSFRIAFAALLLGSVMAAPLDQAAKDYCPCDDSHQECCDPLPYCEEDPCGHHDYCRPQDDCDEHHYHHYPPPPYDKPDPPYPYPFPFPYPYPQPQPQPQPNPPVVCNTTLLNGNFAQGLAKWTPSNPQAITAVLSPPAAPGFGNTGGGSAVQFAVTAAGTPGLTLTQSNIQVCAARRYTITYQVSVDATIIAAGCVLNISFASQIVSTYPMTAANTGATAQTATFTSTGTTTTTSALVVTLVCANPTAANNGFIFIDNITLVAS